MDLKKLKKLIDSDKERIIIVEDGEPVLVMMDFEEYQKMKGNTPQKEESRESSSPSNEKKEEAPEEKREESREVRENPQRELTVEDLPF